MKQMQINVLNSVTTFTFSHPFQLVITEAVVFGTAQYELLTSSSELNLPLRVPKHLASKLQ